MDRRNRATRAPGGRGRDDRPDPRTQWPDQLRVWPPEAEPDLRPARPPEELPIIAPEDFYPPARRRGHGAVAAAVVFTVLVMTGGGVWAVMGPSDCATADRVRIAADPGIAPVLRDLAERDAARTGCAQVEVQATESAEVAAALAAGAAPPDVWVPESSSWAGLASVGGARGPLRAGTSVARTPVILAVRQARTARLAAGLGAGADEPTWSMVSAGASAPGRLAVRLPDPRRSAVGQAALALGDLGGDLAALRDAIVPDPAAALDLLGSRRAKSAPVAVVATEQSLLARGGADAAGRAAMLYPKEGAVSLDHPYLVLVGDAAQRATALDFQDTITSADGRRAIRAAGFRDGDGRADDGREHAERGLRADEPARLAPLPPERTARALNSLGALTAPVRAVVLVDASASMRRAFAGGSSTRIDVAARLVREAAGRLPQGSHAAVWRFGAGLGSARPYRELLALGPVRGRSAEIRTVTRHLPTGVVGDTGLKEPVLAAFRELSARGSDRPGLVLLITDGARDTGTPDLDDLVAMLESEYDPERPVAVAVIDLGAEAGRRDLNRIAEATGGTAHVARDTRQAGQAVLDALTREREG
ncbi:substrate-binding and VWA domain-containing protein [Spongiactinospora sp. TRM90649]|uniref:substrate-binding and VWA domain-containing protein n=1 Tax=Spongiactinospora sp. TRM90649 TaxID=3031114 RepID=UPI0023F68A3B|nr:substrate-binding and VWA domain-containing protein [Spongiactinospora sp. TRM90649]MDF5756524.1 substrate-binding and VWA domain-containing protein [Spongiactinospora sp. TRM90649]